MGPRLFEYRRRHARRAEIRGHRPHVYRRAARQMIQNIRRAGSRDPVFLLDEIDSSVPTFVAIRHRRCLKWLDPRTEQYIP